MKRCLLILTMFVGALCASAREYADTAIYQGISVKLDIGTPVFELARSAGKIQDYEMAINVRLAKRFYPTIEGGFAMAECARDGWSHRGVGGFGRVGMDMAVVKKGASENNLLIGVRCGGAYQDYDLTGIIQQTEEVEIMQPMVYAQHHFDCWGEIVAGCQVQVWKGFQMGWYVRMKVMFTRKAKYGDALPQYVPGFGYRKDFQWGLSYYLAYKF